MSAMVNGFDSIGDVAEGTISLSHTDVWRCVEHEVTLAAGADCPWCIQESLTPTEFEAWLRNH